VVVALTLAVLLVLAALVVAEMPVQRPIQTAMLARLTRAVAAVALVTQLLQPQAAQAVPVS
jgi:hypothetical protein